MTALVRLAVPGEKVPAPGMRTLFEAAGHSLALFNVGGQLYVIDDSCPQQGSSLCAGRLEGRVIQCRAHGLRFDLLSGYLLKSTQVKVTHYPVEIIDDQAFIIISEESAP